MSDDRRTIPLEVYLGMDWTAVSVDVHGDGLANPLALVTVQRNKEPAVFVRIDLGKIMFLDAPNVEETFHKAQAEKVVAAIVSADALT